MKTLRRWFTRNRVLSHLRIITAVTLMSAAAAMAFVAGGDRLFTVSSPSSPFSEDRAATAKIAGEPDAISINSRTKPGDGPILGYNKGGEGPIGGYEAYKSATRTYPANVIPPSMVQNAKKTFNKIATQTATQAAPTINNVWQSYGPLQNSIEPGVLAFSGATDATASRDTALVIAPTSVTGDCRLWAPPAGRGVGPTHHGPAASPSWTWLT